MFSYNAAFDRNIGWFTEAEQMSLRAKRVAVAGMGGVGGVHLLTLARTGVGAFNIADFDMFDVVNINRQVGATMRTIGRAKVDVLAEMALDINPELRLRRFPHGVREDNLDDFLDGADLFVDGLDFFALGIRRRVFARCAELGVPAITAAPIGMGTAWLSFLPGGMTFEEFFRFEGQDETEQYLRFLMGLTPSGMHRAYLMDPSRIDLAAKRGPSTAAACQLCSGVAAVAAVKLLLGRGDAKPAPWHHHFDPYAGRYVRSRMAQGNDGRMQRLRLAVARRAIARRSPASAAIAEPVIHADAIEAILDAARWAPSGDNEQPWSFERAGDDAVIVHIRGPAADNVYEYRGGEPLLLGAGMLLASLQIAASDHGRRAEWALLDAPSGWRIEVKFPAAPELPRDRLLPALPARTVDRTPYRTRPLSAAEKTSLAAALGDALQLTWHEPWRDRLAIARLTARATDIRLRARETFETHRKVVDWDRALSPTGIPSLALGLPAPMLRMMRWAMGDRTRMERMNRIVGTGGSAMQMDVLPGLASAAYFSLRAPGWQEGDAGAALRAGVAIQRFWLEATRLGLAMQPALATVIFADYGARGRAFTADERLAAKARSLAQSFEAVLGCAPQQMVFMGRIGAPKPGRGPARSIRRPLSASLTATARPTPS